MGLLLALLDQVLDVERLVGRLQWGAICNVYRLLTALGARRLARAWGELLQIPTVLEKLYPGRSPKPPSSL